MSYSFEFVLHNHNGDIDDHDEEGYEVDYSEYANDYVLMSNSRHKES